MLRRTPTPPSPHQDRPPKDEALRAGPGEDDDHAGLPPRAQPPGTAPDPRAESLADERGVLDRLAELTSALNDPRAAALALFTDSEIEPEPASGPEPSLAPETAGTRPSAPPRRPRRRRALRRSRTAAPVTE